MIVPIANYFVNKQSLLSINFFIQLSELVYVKFNQHYFLTQNHKFRTKNRNYSYKDVDMLTASKIVAENFNTNIAI